MEAPITRLIWKRYYLRCTSTLPGKPWSFSVFYKMVPDYNPDGFDMSSISRPAANGRKEEVREVQGLRSRSKSSCRKRVDRTSIHGDSGNSRKETPGRRPFKQMINPQGAISRTEDASAGLDNPDSNLFERSNSGRVYNNSRLCKITEDIVNETESNNKVSEQISNKCYRRVPETSSYTLNSAKSNVVGISSSRINRVKKPHVTSANVGKPSGYMRREPSQKASRTTLRDQRQPEPPNMADYDTSNLFREDYSKLGADGSPKLLVPGYRLLFVPCPPELGKPNSLMILRPIVKKGKVFTSPESVSFYLRIPIKALQNLLEAHEYAPFYFTSDEINDIRMAAGYVPPLGVKHRTRLIFSYENEDYFISYFREHRIRPH